MTTTVVDVPQRRRRPGTRLRREVVPWAFAAPAVVLFLAFMLAPILFALYLSFRGRRLTGEGAFARPEETFVGLANYADALTDPVLLAGLGRVLLYGAVAVPLTLGLALLFALLVDSPAARARSFSRTAIFLPYAVPGVIASLLWGFLYLPSTSPVSYLSRQLGGESLSFLGQPVIYLALANIALWGGVGFNMIVIYTSLRSVPEEIYEAARIDGAGELAIALRIKVPLVVPALVLTGLFSVIGTLQLYAEPTTLQPLTTTISSTWVPLMAINETAFVNGDLGGGAAASVLLALLTLAASLVLLRFLQRRAFGDL